MNRAFFILCVKQKHFYYLCSAMKRKAGPLTKGFYMTREDKLERLLGTISEIPDVLEGHRTEAALDALVNRHWRPLWNEKGPPVSCSKAHCSKYDVPQFIEGNTEFYDRIFISFDTMVRRVRPHDHCDLQFQREPLFRSYESLDGVKSTELFMKGAPGQYLECMDDEDVTKMLESMAAFLHHNGIHPDDFHFDELRLSLADPCGRTFVVALRGERVTPFGIAAHSDKGPDS